MKQYIILFLLIFPGFIFAQDNNTQLWGKGNSLYSAGNYQQAIATYEQILHTGHESASLYFNLGNAYHKAGNNNMAILNYERAKLLAPNDENIDFNLGFANQNVVTKVDPLPLPFFLRWKTGIINMHSASEWSYISISAFILFLALTGFFIFGRAVSIRRVAFFAGILALLFSGFTFSFAAKQKEKIANRSGAIIFCPRVTVKSAPTKTGTDLFLIYEGLKVNVTDSTGTWREIKLADGNEGWLPDSCIVKI